MNRFIGIVCTVAMFAIPAITFGASSLQTALSENAYVVPINNKDGIYAFIYTPQDWGSKILGDGSGGFTIGKSFPGVDIGGSIGITMPEISDAVLANKSITWLAQNYFRERISNSTNLQVIKKAKVSIAGVTGYSTIYTSGGTSTYLTISFVKSGKLYLAEAQTPTKYWKANKKAIDQSLASIEVGKFVINM
jgi:hypothetical protein